MAEDSTKSLWIWFYSNVRCPYIKPNLPLNFTFEPDDDYVEEDADTELKIKTFSFITIYFVVFFLGFFGNGLVIYLILKVKKLQGITSLFLVSLASADILLIIICVPLKVIEFITNQWGFGFIICKLFHYLHFFTAICSVMNLTAMSLERYFAILHPIKAKIRCTHRRAKLIILFIWIFSIMAASPILLGKELVKIGINPVDICKRVWCTGAHKVFEIYRALILLIVPFVIMGFCYIRISCELYTMPIIRKKTRNEPKKTVSDNDRRIEHADTSEMDTLQTEISTTQPSVQSNVNIIEPRNYIAKKSVSFRSHSDDEAMRRQIIKILICIVVIFWICWAPIILNNVLVAFEVLPKINFGIHWYIRIVFHLLAYGNSCVNPIVYGFMSKKFREAFKKVFCSSDKENMYASIELHRHTQTTETSRNQFVKIKT